MNIHGRYTNGYPSDLVSMSELYTSSTDRHVRGGTTHVQCDEVMKPRVRCDMESPGNTARWAAKHGAYGLTAGKIQRDAPARRLHNPQGCL